MRNLACEVTSVLRLLKSDSPIESDDVEHYSGIEGQ